MLFSKIWERKREQLKMGKWKMWVKNEAVKYWGSRKCQSRKFDIKEFEAKLC